MAQVEQTGGQNRLAELEAIAALNGIDTRDEHWSFALALAQLLAKEKFVAEQHDAQRASDEAAQDELLR